MPKLPLKRPLAFLAFTAGFVFLLLAALGTGLDSVDKVPAGLASLAAGFVIQHLPD
jgi:hypothetical protein